MVPTLVLTICFHGFRPLTGAPLLCPWLLQAVDHGLPLTRLIFLFLNITQLVLVQVLTLGCLWKLHIHLYRPKIIANTDNCTDQKIALNTNMARFPVLMNTKAVLYIPKLKEFRLILQLIVCQPWPTKLSIDHFRKNWKYICTTLFFYFFV